MAKGDKPKKEQKQAPKEEKAPKEQKEQRPEPKKEEKPATGKQTIAAVAVIIVIIAAAAVLLFYVLPFYFPSATPNVPFSTFKTNFLSASRVAVVAEYTNSTVGPTVENCAIKVIGDGIEMRAAPPKIDYFVITPTNCTYSPLGKIINESSETPAQCLSMASSEPSIFLNYSATNKTVITAYRMGVWGNIEYLGICPIAVDLAG